ncbi:MAG: hypothetical protein HOY71_01165 [Nonomuraea sp.]|nr:hypothetical protein [Nonomuraea sp.]
MKFTYAACAMLAALTLTACGGTAEPKPTTTKAAAERPAGKVEVVYEQVTKNQDLEPIRQDWEQSKDLEGVSELITSVLKLPYDITVAGRECGETNAFWEPDTKSIVVCYELEPWLKDTFAQLYDDQEVVDDKAGDAAVGVLLHELGHAAVTMYDLPITGKEEDAVDQLATVLLASSGDEDAAQMALDFGEFWQILAGNSDLADLDFADEHSTDDQRAYNVMCWVLGSNPEKYTETLVGAKEDGLLPESRAERCPGEYEQIQGAWLKLLKPHLAA